MKPRAEALPLALALLLVASGALGQAAAPKPAQLDYDRGNLTVCPAESFFRVFVAGRLGGQDPFPAEASRRIKLTLRRRPRTFAAEVAMYDQAGARLGGDELSEPDCTAVVEGAGLLWSSLDDGAAERARAESARSPRSAPSQRCRLCPNPAPPPVEAKPGAEEAPWPPTPPAAKPKPGVFEGKGRRRARGPLRLNRGGLAMGGAFVLATDNKGNGAREVGQAIQAKEGPSACMTPRSGDCQEIAQLAQQHDTLRQLAVGSFVAAGVVGAIATAAEPSGLSARRRRRPSRFSRPQVEPAAV